MKLMGSRHIDGVYLGVGAEIFHPFINSSAELCFEPFPGLFPQVGSGHDLDVRMGKHLREGRGKGLT
jgi:hypothetical protein